MTKEYKILGQSAPSATTETLIYTVPLGKQCILSNLHVCNRAGTATTFRLSVSRSGGATATKDYLYYDLPLIGNDAFQATMGVTLSERDVVRVYAGNANLSFNLSGTEITP